MISFLEIRAAARRIVRRPATTALVVLTLALGIGATTAVVSTIRGVLFAPLPFPEADRLVNIRELESERDFGNAGYKTILDWKSVQSFSSVAAAGVRSYTLTGAGDAMQLNALGVTHDLFETFGAAPLLGREFEPADDVPDAPRSVVISEELWTSRFGADPSLLGRAILLDGNPTEVIGVMPGRTRIRESEWQGAPVDAWVALKYSASLPRACRGCRHLRAYARLAESATLESAAREVEAFTDALRTRYPDEYPRNGFVRLVSLQDSIVGRPAERALWILLGVAALVLLVAIANAANLALAQLVQRRDEIAIRRSLGASAGRIVRLVTGEVLLQAIAASVAGVALAAGAIGWIRLQAGGNLPRSGDLSLDWRVAATAVAIALASGFAIGLVPAWRAGRWLRQGSGARVVDERGKGRTLLVGVSVALSCVLLSSTLLLLRSVTNLFSIDPGFDPRNVLTFQAYPGGEKYDEHASTLAFYDQIVSELEASPGVETVALTTQLPFAGNTDNAGLVPEDRPELSGADAPDAHRFGVTPGYLEAMRLPLRKGRFFTAADTTGSEPVVVLNETAARTLWPGEDPIGKRVRVAGGEDNPFRTVIGIVGDVHHGELGAPFWPQAYVPMSQFPWGPFVVVIRTAHAPEGAIGTAREVMRGLDPDVPVFAIATLDSLVSGSEATRTFILGLLGGFSAVAVALGMIGVYGVLSFAVASRRREVGVRIALGATAGRVFRLIVGEGMRMVLIALTAGLVAALTFGRLLEGFLHGVTSRDPIALGGTVALLALAALAASALPGWRAARMDAAEALKQE